MKTSTRKHEEVPDLLVMRADAVWTSCEQQHCSVHSRVYTSCPASCCSTGSAPRLEVPTCSCCCERVGPDNLLLPKEFSEVKRVNKAEDAVSSVSVEERDVSVRFRLRLLELHSERLEHDRLRQRKRFRRSHEMHL